MTITTTPLRRKSVALAGVAAAALLLAACGSSTDDPGTSSAAPSASGAPDVPGLSEAQALVDKFIAPQGTFIEPPVEGGPKAAPDKSVWIISCGESSSSCQRATKGATDAAEAIGWESTLFDTKGDYSQAATGIRQAIAAKADGIFMYFIDCSYASEPLREAKEAGIPVVSAEGADCNDTDASAEPLFAWSVTYAEGPLLTWIKSWAQAQAAYLIVDGEGKGHSLYVVDSEAVLSQRQLEAYNELMAKCTGCTSVVSTHTFAQQYDGLSQQVSNELIKDEGINQVGVAYDGILQAGVSEAVTQAVNTGRTIAVMTGEGQTPTIELVKQGVVTAGVGLDNEAEAWSAIDSLNRLFQNVEPVTSGIGVQIYDADNNLPASGPYVSPIDYQSIYKAAWGV